LSLTRAVDSNFTTWINAVTLGTPGLPGSQAPTLKLDENSNAGLIDLEPLAQLFLKRVSHSISDLVCFAAPDIPSAASQYRSWVESCSGFEDKPYAFILLPDRGNEHCNANSLCISANVSRERSAEVFRGTKVMTVDPHITHLPIDLHLDMACARIARQEAQHLWSDSTLQFLANAVIEHLARRMTQKFVAAEALSPTIASSLVKEKAWLDLVRKNERKEWDIIMVVASCLASNGLSIRHGMPCHHQQPDRC
jgi:hypothetical protein